MRAISHITISAISLVMLLSGCKPETSPSFKKTKENTVEMFQEVSEETGLNFIHDPGVSGKYFMPESLGAGAALFDYDNDGDLDIYLINGAGMNRLFRQENNGRFTDVSESSGLGDRGYGMGATAADIDNDGDIDIYVTNYGPDRLYINNGNGTFINVTEKSGIQDKEWSASAAFLDYDRDGFLDLYVTRYVQYDPSVSCRDKAGRLEYCGPKLFEGVTDILYHNNGNGTFTDVSTQSGIAAVAMKGLGVVCADFNDDGYPDIYVANDGEPNLLWINQRNGTFRNEAIRHGAAVNLLGQPEASMGVDAGDPDGDGDPDLFLTHLHDEKNTFYRNDGASGFLDNSLASGLAGPSIPYTGFGAGFFDFDRDGDLDVAVVNGRIEKGNLLTQSNQNYWDAYAEPNLLFENDGTGRFQDISKKANTFASDIRTHRGLAFGDIDNDGDIDLLVTAAGGPAKLYRNQAKSNGGWLLLNLIDPKLKRHAIGAIVRVRSGSKLITRQLNPHYSYLCSNDPRVHFGLGDSATADEIRITWPDGKEEFFHSVASNRILTLSKGSGK